MAVTNLNQYLTQGAMEGFGEIIAPLTSFSYVVKPEGASLNDVVRVPFVQNTSASADFSYSTGYTADSNTIAGKPVTLDIIKYQKITLSDADLAKLNPEALVRLGRVQGQRLAADFISASFAATITAGTYTNQAAYSSSAYTASVAFADLDKKANDLKWPDGERFLIAGTTLWMNMLSNQMVVNASNFGSSEAVQQGKLNNVFGFTPHKVSLTLPASATGFAVNPDAILVANAYHAPQDAGSSYIAADQIVHEGTGLTIGFRQYYDSEKATSVRVFDVLGGAAVGNASALIRIN